MTFSASFEVYPEVKIDDLSTGKISRPVVNLSEADVAKTLEVLQKQRRTFESTDRAAAEGDLLKFNYQGTVDGAAFEGGKGEDFAAVIGEGRLLKDFEQNLTGLKAGDSKAFDLTFRPSMPPRNLPASLRISRCRSRMCRLPCCRRWTRNSPRRWGRRRRRRETQGRGEVQSGTRSQTSRTDETEGADDGTAAAEKHAGSAAEPGGDGKPTVCAA